MSRLAIATTVRAYSSQYKWRRGTRWMGVGGGGGGGGMVGLIIKSHDALPWCPLCLHGTTGP